MVDIHNLEPEEDMDNKSLEVGAYMDEDMLYFDNMD